MIDESFTILTCQTLISMLMEVFIKLIVVSVTFLEETLRFYEYFQTRVVFRDSRRLEQSIRY